VAGTKLTITAKGSDAQAAIDALKDLIENKLFGEEGRQVGKKPAE
jgi:phosphotransferase system HPr-like phosphotransfer protein